MQLRTGLELNFEGRVLAWALDYPGCFAYGEDQQEALLRLPQAFIIYQRWVHFKAGEKSWLTSNDDLDVVLLESFRAYVINENFELTDQEGYEVNAWFQSDWIPLSAVKIEHGLLLMDWSRQDLLDLLADISPDLREKEFARERWNIPGILNHIAGTGWWYLNRLGLTDLTRNEVLKAPFERLNEVREQVKQTLPQLLEKELVIGKDSEFWSPRKLVRRILWHEKDHIHHIYKLIS